MNFPEVEKINDITNLISEIKNLQKKLIELKIRKGTKQKFKSNDSKIILNELAKISRIKIKIKISEI